MKKNIIYLQICALMLGGCASSTMSVNEETYYKEDESVVLDTIYDVIDSFEEYEELYGANAKTNESVDTETKDKTDTSYQTYNSDYEVTAYEQGFYIELIQNLPENETIIINNGIPYYNKEDFSAEEYEYYGELDELGRCTSCFCCIGPETLPVTDRGDISEIKPTGYDYQSKYDIIESWEPESEGYLYNRCHLIGWQLTGEDANEKNLITGTRYLNVSLMLEYENEIASYVRTTGHHVLYRVTPIFKDDELVAAGVLMEAQSIEDNTIQFNVYARNIQPGITIDYQTGASWETAEIEQNYILNIRSKKIHSPGCDAIDDIGKNNKMNYFGVKSYLISELGYTTCSVCEP